MNYRFHPAAEAEHLGQIAFYESRRKGLGARYRRYFLQMMQRVCERPAQYPIERPPDIPRARLQPFPLTLIYREGNSTIQVLAVAHSRRQPGYWLSRAHAEPGNPEGAKARPGSGGSRRSLRSGAPRVLAREQRAQLVERVERGFG